MTNVGRNVRFPRDDTITVFDINLKTIFLSVLIRPSVDRAKNFPSVRISTSTTDDNRKLGTVYDRGDLTYPIAFVIILMFLFFLRIGVMHTVGVASFCWPPGFSGGHTGQRKAFTSAQTSTNRTQIDS